VSRLIEAHDLQDRLEALEQVLGPTPVELIRRCLVNSSPPKGIVLDPFSGSGSTLVACEMQGLDGRGVELDPRYCDVIIRRFAELTGQEARLEEA